MRCWSGLADYYQMLIEEFSKLALPLTQLTRKGQTFVWDTKCEKSFQEFKKMLTSTLALI